MDSELNLLKNLRKKWPFLAVAGWALLNLVACGKTYNATPEIFPSISYTCSDDGSSMTMRIELDPYEVPSTFEMAASYAGELAYGQLYTDPATGVVFAEFKYDTRAFESDNLSVDIYSIQEDRSYKNFFSKNITSSLACTFAP